MGFLKNFFTKRRTVKYRNKIQKFQDYLARENNTDLLSRVFSGERPPELKSQVKKLVAGMPGESFLEENYPNNQIIMQTKTLRRYLRDYVQLEGGFDKRIPTYCANIKKELDSILNIEEIENPNNSEQTSYQPAVNPAQQPVPPQNTNPPPPPPQVQPAQVQNPSPNVNPQPTAPQNSPPSPPQNIQQTTTEQNNPNQNPPPTNQTQ